MNTTDLMNTALKLAHLDKMPYDTDIIVAGENIKKVLIGIDMETPELLLAQQLGFDCVVSHHPKADSCVVDFAKVMDVQIDRMVKSDSYKQSSNRRVKPLGILYRKSCLTNY